ncbi:OmpP1/FadL family transporter [Alloalcanivorax gelatiniphagus]|uniref:Aromatic hydrocarbon degradation protein n=1 Tax=Alloalcanivorax gelatiniphagus TaxID=1194167 RepID=A0ABY2XMA0_9GAMM|nr:outer membrane protein transport protein [Alloalcanivorax gelatiniphagus]TMW12909.1 aromatic hydrocarbon degradation protein [Alloalcanivorax gelatiniphagus]
MSRNSITTNLLSAGVMLALSSTAMAGMSNAPSTYGMFPSDVASAQAFSIFSSTANAVYYNPAALAQDSRGQLTGALLHGEADLGYKDAVGGPARSGRISDEPSQQLILGLKADASDMLTTGHPIYLALMLGSEEYGREMLGFSSETSDSGQYLTYGRNPLFLNVGVATPIWRGIDFGASINITLDNNAELDSELELSGETAREDLDVSAKTRYRPIVGFNVAMGETFCPDGCWLDRLTAAVAYRAHSQTETSVDATPSVNGLIPGGLPLRVANVIEGYQPDIYSVGLRYDMGRTRLAFTGEFQQWSDLGDEFSRDTIKDQGMLEFKDTFVPRVGLEFDFTDALMLTTGVAFEESPLDSDVSPDVNYLDADKLVIGVGLSATFKNPPLLAWPLTVDLAYQHQQLDQRRFDIVTTNPASSGTPTSLKTDGDVNVFSGSVTLKF